MALGGFLSRLKQGLARSTAKLTEGIGADLRQAAGSTRRRSRNSRDLLIGADLGTEVARKVIASFRRSRFGTEVTDQEVKEALADEIAAILAPVAKPLVIDRDAEAARRAGRRRQRHRQDDHDRQARAAISRGRACAPCWWPATPSAPRRSSSFRCGGSGRACRWWPGRPIPTPPASRSTRSPRAQAERADVLLIDTAGRLHNKAALMEELRKIIRVIRKQDETAPHSVLLVLDATTGQNALQQVNVFRDMVDVTGLIVTKLDGSARGGVVVALAEEFGVPVHAVGVGEQAADLRVFDPQEFARGLVGL